MKITTLTHNRFVRAGAILMTVLVLPFAASASEVTGTVSTHLDSDGVGGTVIVTPSITPVGATYTSARTVSITASGSSRIYYTSNGSTPSCGTGTSYSGAVGTQYSGSFGVPSSMTIKAVACFLDGESSVHGSAVSSAAYTINTPSSGGGGGGGSSHHSGGSSGASVPSTTSGTTVTVGTSGTTVTTASAGTSGGQAFTVDLSSGSNSSDVKRLQQFLNTHGFIVAATGAGSPGNETNTFGPATQAALAKYQAARGISPAVGYFGALTRASVNAEIGGTTTTPTTPVTTTVSAPVSTGSFTRDLDLGATGADVTALQQYLIGKGYAIPAGVTGYFGAQTQSALAAFQAASGISPAAGYFGPFTRSFVAAHP